MLTQHRKGEEMSLEILKSGCVLGHYSLFDGRRMVYNAKISSPKASIFVIKKAQLMKVLEKEKLADAFTEFTNN